MPLNDNRTILKVFLASPRDVLSERDSVVRAVQSVNLLLEAVGRPYLIQLRRWEDVFPAADEQGPQAHIESTLDIDDIDILVGVFWRRFGTETSAGQTGTEHEIRRAYQAWEANRKPQIMLYFSQQQSSPGSSEELEQWRKVVAFREEFQTKNVLTVQYHAPAEFTARIITDLAQLCFRLTAETVQQEAPSCFVTADPRWVRAEGLTELLGELRLTFRSALRTSAAEAVERCKIKLVLNTSVSSARTSDLDTDAHLVEQLSSQEGEGNATFGPVFGTLDGTNSLVFDNVPLGPLSAGGRTFCIRNVRANVAALGIPAAGEEFPARWVVAYIAVQPVGSDTQASTVTESVNVVGSPLLGTAFRFRGADDTGSTLPAIVSARELRNEALAGGEPDAKGAIHVRIRLKEGYPKAFKTASEEQGEHPPVSACVTSGTRFLMKFFDVPARVRVFVTAADIGSGTMHSSHRKVSCVIDADANGVGGSLYDYRPSAADQHTNEGVLILPVGIQAGVGFAVWEWVSSRPRRPHTTDEVTLGVLFAVEPGYEPLSTVKVSANLAPISTCGRSAPIGEAIPRFIALSTPRTVAGFIPDQ